MERALALLFDRDPVVRSQLRGVVEQHGMRALDAADTAKARAVLRRRPIRALFVDPADAENGWLESGRAVRPEPVVVVLLDRDAQGDAERWIGQGAFDVLFKPFEVGSLRRLASRVRREMEARSRSERWRRELQEREGYRGLVGSSPGIERLRAELKRLGEGDASVWFQGESGTGKEFSARLLHRASRRGSGKFIVLDCAGVRDGGGGPPWVGETDRFWEKAAGGSVFLDEVVELPLGMQERLALALARESTDEAIESPARLLSASRREPRRAVQEGRLLESLQRRLCEETLTLPPLRERRADIPLLVRSFLESIAEINHLPSLRLSAEALTLLEAHGWPGNVQELRNAVEHAVIVATDGVIGPEHLPERLLGRSADARASGPRGTRPFREAKREVVESFERAYLSDLMEEFGGNVTSAAQSAGMLRSALQRLLRKYGLKSSHFRRAGRVTRDPGPRPSRVE